MPKLLPSRVLPASATGRRDPGRRSRGLLLALAVALVLNGCGDASEQRRSTDHTIAPDVADADILLNQAAEMAADLIVVGAYGHSRIREMVLGGVTRTLLKQMTVPVLMSH